MAEKQLRITETDEAGNVTTKYIQSATSQDGMSRIDAFLPEVTKSPWQRLLDVFLPAGYPHSVTNDYTEYQIYDSLQAFSSSIASLLSSRAVLSSVGVGDATASPTAALLLSILQESAGRIATILFAHRFGTALEPECKMYRLLADILNDIAFVLDCLSPSFPKALRVVVLSFSSVLRALCGVAAGSAKASLSAHFAKWGNLGELNAKDSSQETVISLLGMLVGSLVVSWVTTPIATWTTLVLLLAIHLETNRRAVRAVTMRTLNRQRAAIVFSHLRKHQHHVPTPEEVSKEERIFERDGVLRNSRGRNVGFCTIGASFSRFLESIASPHPKTKSAQVSSDLLPRILTLYDNQEYLLWYMTNSSSIRVEVVVKKSASARHLLTAWWQALILAEQVIPEEPLTEKRALMTRNERSLLDLNVSLMEASHMLKECEGDLTKAGWDLDAAALETNSSTRVSVST